MSKFINPFQAYYDTNGEPLSGGKLWFYEAGTLNTLAVYADSDLTTPLSNPVIADAEGRFVTMYMQKESYKIQLLDSNDVSIAIVDDYDFTNQAAFDDIKQQATTTYQGVVELATVEEVKAGTDTERAVTSFSIAQALAALTVSPIGLMDGFIVSNAADVDHDLDTGTGTCRNATNDGDITLATSLVKQIDAVWQVGTDMGGMPATIAKTGTFTTSGTDVTGVGTAFQTEFKVGDILNSNSLSQSRVVVDITNDTTMEINIAFSPDIAVGETVYKNGLAEDATYHKFVIVKTDGTVDSGYDTQTNAENLLVDANVVVAGYVKYRRIFSFVTDAGGNILPFVGTIDSGGSMYVSYNSSIQDVSVTDLVTGTTRLFDLSVPKGINILPKTTIELVRGSSGALVAALVPDNQTVFTFKNLYITTTIIYNAFSVNFPTSNATAKVIIETEGGTVTFAILINGYTDYRN